MRYAILKHMSSLTEATVAVAGDNGLEPAHDIQRDEYESISSASSLLMNALSLEEKLDLVLENYVELEVEILDRAVRHGGWNELPPGSMASLEGSASVFRVQPEDRDLNTRLAAFDIHPALPLWGRGRADTDHYLEGINAAYIALARGSEPLAELGWRAARLAVRNLDWRIAGDTLHLSFTLVRGGFATAVLRELVAYQDASGAEPSGSSST